MKEGTWLSALCGVHYPAEKKRKKKNTEMLVGLAVFSN